MGALVEKLSRTQYKRRPRSEASRLRLGQLTDSQLKEAIRRRQKGETCASIARLFNVSRQSVSRHLGNRLGFDKSKSPVLPEGEAERRHKVICEMREAGETWGAIGEALGMKQKAVKSWWFRQESAEKRKEGS